MMFGDLPANWPEPVKRQVAEAASSGRIAAIRGAAAAIESMPQELRGKPFRLLIARTFTLETQIDAIKLALAAIPCNPAVDLAALENIEQVLLDPNSPEMRARPDAVLVLWRLEELLPQFVSGNAGMSGDERKSAVQGAIERITRLCDAYIKDARSSLFLATLPAPLGMSDALADLHRPYGLRDALLRINQSILDLAARHNQIHVFDFAAWATACGHAAFDLKMELYARQPIAAAFVTSFADALAACLRPLLRPAAKVLAVDLDNMLWGGVVGEDGIAGLKIGHDFPGNIYRRIQQALLRLKSRGVLLVLLSKNNPEDVKDAFAALPDMPLRFDDFTAVRINWEPKHENLRSIAGELNLGLDSFVFLDDQAFEREQMAFRLPEVNVLPASEDPLHILNTITACRDFDIYRTSAEDLTRAGDYRAQSLRKQLGSESENAESFLKTLQLKAVVARVGESRLGRAVQMLAKTNQFNVTTRRHSEAEMRRMCGDPRCLLLTLSLSDRFGDQGIIGLAIGVRGESDEEMRVDSFLLSCRALGRGAEQALWGSLLTKARALGYRTVRAEYLPTAKNQQVADLFDRFGMTREKHGDAGSSYTLQLSALPKFPAWLEVIDQTDS